MGRIRPVLLSLKSDRNERQISLALVNHWMEDLRGIPYGFSREWKTPREVEAGVANPTISLPAYETEQLLSTHTSAVTSTA